MDGSEIILKGDDGDIVLEVIEQTTLNGVNYVLVVEKENEFQNDEVNDFEDEAEDYCSILKEVLVDSNGIADYVVVENEEEYEKVSEIFKKILIRDDIELI